MTVKPGHRSQGFSLSKNAKLVIYSQLSAERTATVESRANTDKLCAGRAFYNDADVAALLDISIGRLRNKISAGDPLPPRLQADGFRKRLWPCQAFHEWLRQFEKAQINRQRDGLIHRS
jgi:hypothetical protein